MDLFKKRLYKFYKELRYYYFLPRGIFGVQRKIWEKRQLGEELDYWKNPTKYEPLEGHKTMKERLLSININMFNGLKRTFHNGVVCEIGCGPYGGLLPKIKAKTKFGLDPLANEYKKLHSEPEIIMLKSIAEEMPFTDSSLDAVFCVNALDHVLNPSKVINEIYRVLKKGGYLALSVDVDGTPGHPHVIKEKYLDRKLKGKYKVIEKKCSGEIKSSWNADLEIPLYVFQGLKI
jgi:SAM-dependent methyltransferase